jgi:hypothetical protein
MGKSIFFKRVRTNWKVRLPGLSSELRWRKSAWVLQPVSTISSPLTRIFPLAQVGGEGQAQEIGGVKHRGSLLLDSLCY